VGALLTARLLQAARYDDWEAAATDLDDLEGYDAWKENGESDDYYNGELIASRLRDLDEARASGDVTSMMNLVRTSLSRDIGGSGSASLYNHSHVGTKKLVEKYVRASVEIVDALVEQTKLVLPPGMTHRDVHDNLVLARKNFGRSALVLSGGSVYGMAHIGVLKAIWEKQLLPKIISGTSAGSIVASVICTKKDEEVLDVLEKFAEGDLSVFTDKDNPDSWFMHLSRAVRYGAWHDNRHISRVMREQLGDLTFQEGFNRTGRILNITVSSKPGLQLPPILNYMTAPNVIIWSAVVASCSVPGVFDARPLLIRDEVTGEHIPWDPAEQLWIDGSLDNDIPVERLGELFGVNHFIVSQANPHIVVFVTNEDKRMMKDQLERSPFPGADLIRNVVSTAAWLGKSEAEYYLENLIETGLFKGGLSMLVKMLRQKYTADINIIPRMSLRWATHLIRNPTPEFMREACDVGEQATWPTLRRIKNSVAVELALDRAVHALRERIAFSESQVNLRRLFTGSPDLGIPVDEAKVRKRHHRRGSGGSIQLSARRRWNIDSLDTVMSEESHDSDPESSGVSLAARRGLQGLTLPSILLRHGQVLPYRGPIKQNSLQQLPMVKTPQATSPAARKTLQGYGFNTLAPFTRVTCDDSADSDDEAESPLLSMKLKRGGSPARPRPEETVAAESGHKDEQAAFADVEENVASDAEPYGSRSLSSPEPVSAVPVQSRGSGKDEPEDHHRPTPLDLMWN